MNERWTRIKGALTTQEWRAGLLASVVIGLHVVGFSSIAFLLGILVAIGAKGVDFRS